MASRCMLLLVVCPLSKLAAALQQHANIGEEFWPFTRGHSEEEPNAGKAKVAPASHEDNNGTEQKLTSVDGEHTGNGTKHKLTPVDDEHDSNGTKHKFAPGNRDAGNISNVSKQKTTSAVRNLSLAEESHGQNAELVQLPRVGNTAPLTETGYQLVSTLKSDDEMKAFIHRVLEAEGRYAADKSELNGLVKYYSGTQGVQSLGALKQELRHARWVNQGEGRTAALSEAGYQQVAGRNSRAGMTAFVRRILQAEHKVVADEGALAGLVPYHSGEVSVQSFDKLKQDLLSADWVRDADAQATLTEAGYQLVASHKSDDEMKAFVHRVAESEARYVANATELSGLVPYYSGTLGVQSLEALKRELRQAWWVHPGEGRTAALSEVGYQQVAAGNSRAHMTAFARRILRAEHKVVVNEGALAGLVPYHNGEISVQSFDKLKEDLLSADWVKDDSDTVAAEVA